jgi:flagellar basal body rod protein FlgB
MPRTFNSKQTSVTMTIPESDIFEITDITISNQSQSIYIHWRSLNSQEEGNPVEVTRNVIQLSNTEFTDIGNTVTLDGETIYAAIKRICYATLEAKGIFPSGGTDS